MRNIIFFLLFIGPALILRAQVSLNDINFSHLYNPTAEIDVYHEAYKVNDSIKLSLKLIKYQKKAHFTDYSINIYTAGSYGQKIKAVPGMGNQTLSDTTNTDSQWNIYLPPEMGAELLVVEVKSKFSGLSYFYDIPVQADKIIIQDQSGKELFRTWLSPGNYYVNSNRPLFGYFYSHEFPPALPPMPVNDDIPPKTMEIDSTFQLDSTGRYNFFRQGLYLVQRDTNTNVGQSFRVEDKYYPRFVRLDRLIEPLIYITTMEENTQLKNINGNKRKFDQFWIDVTSSPERAKNIIKTYFDRVESVNRFFTEYKEGWKTDMGMIYIIFGPPDEVQKSERGQTWTYLESPQLPKINFGFIKTENIFSSKNYVLIREKKNASVWFRAIDLWRKGRF